MADHLSRRGILKLAAGSAVAAVLAACGGGSSATNTPASATKAATTPLAGGTGGQTPLAGGTGGQTPIAAATSAPAATTAAGSSAAAATKPAGSAAAPSGTTAAAPIGTTAAGSFGVSPTNTPNPTPKGNASYWQVTADDPNLPSEKYHDQWVPSLKTTLPNVNFKEERYNYNDLLDKLRVTQRAGQGPDSVVLPVTGSPEFAANGSCLEINLADFGYKTEDFWPGALKSASWNGKLYGIPTNNETMAFIYNKEIFTKAGLDPNKGPETWEEVKSFSKQIKEKTGKAGFGMVAKLNAGNTSFRFMPLCWAYGGGALDETADVPTYQKSQLDSEGTIAALQWISDVYVRDQSAPQSTLTNTQIENRDLFVSGEIAMMIDHPSAYQLVKAKSPDLAEKMNYVLMPKGPARRAVVFGGSNFLIFKTAKDVDAIKAVAKDRTSPYWSIRFAWEGSNPGNRQAFSSPEQKQRQNDIKFLNVTTEMLQYGISYPAIPENADIMNLIVPQMMQDVLTKAKTPQQAGQDAAKKVNDLIAKRK